MFRVDEREIAPTGALEFCGSNPVFPFVPLRFWFPHGVRRFASKRRGFSDSVELGEKHQVQRAITQNGIIHNDARRGKCRAR
jgi:hypothetical protein